MATMKTNKQMYDALTTEPAKPSMAATSKKMDMASTMFEGAKPKKMAAGGSASSRADGCAQRGKTKGRMV